MCAHSNTFSSYLGYHLSLDEDTKGQRLGGLLRVLQPTRVCAEKSTMYTLRVMFYSADKTEDLGAGEDS